MQKKVMGRAALGIGFAWLLAMGSSAFALQGCASEPAAEKEVEAGNIDLALTATSTSGIVYRLRDAQISITGAAITSVLTEDFIDQSEVELELPAGGYLAALSAGWRLERLVDGVFEDVRAVLVSTNPLPFTVTDQETTDVRLTFRAGDDVVELGNGRVRIGVDVIDGDAPPSSVCDDACAVAAGLACDFNDACWGICAELGNLIGDPACLPLADEYMVCAAVEPGETYMCTADGYPIAGACEGEFQALLDCLSAPCTVDGDGDGSCEGSDCNDADGSVFPGAPDACGDGIDQNCNGVDDPCGPTGWSCDVNFYGTSDGCDCGCGIPDPDCSSSDVSVCEFCNDPGSCNTGACPGTIDPGDNAVCL
jgi:hypothetical protein